MTYRMLYTLYLQMNRLDLIHFDGELLLQRVSGEIGQLGAGGEVEGLQRLGHVHAGPVPVHGLVPTRMMIKKIYLISTQTHCM